MRLPRSAGIALGWGLVALIWAASLLTPPTTGLEIPNEDKWGHLLSYGLLMGWFAIWYPSRKTRAAYFAGFVLMGGLLELIQGQLPAREASLLDFAANTAGLLLGWFLVTTFRRRKARG
ncbi:MAG: VanZ family protein [Pseudomonadota bacterium]